MSSPLASLPALTSLTIAFRLEQGYDNSSVLRAVASTCPHLRHLDLTVTSRPSFPMVNSHFPPSPCNQQSAHMIPPTGNLRALHPPPRPLAHVHLRIVPSPGEDTPLTCGARLVRASPRLTTFDLVFFAHAPPLGRGPS